MGILETKSLILHSIDLFKRYEGFMFNALLQVLLDPEKDKDEFLLKVIREWSASCVCKLLVSRPY